MLVFCKWRRINLQINTSIVEKHTDTYFSEHIHTALQCSRQTSPSLTPWEPQSQTGASTIDRCSAVLPHVVLSEATEHVKVRCRYLPSVVIRVMDTGAAITPPVAVTPHTWLPGASQSAHSYETTGCITVSYTILSHLVTHNQLTYTRLLVASLSVPSNGATLCPTVRSFIRSYRVRQRQLLHTLQ